MVNVFGDSIASGPGNLQMAKKVVVTEGKFKDYTEEIHQSYELGFTPYRLHKNTDGTFVTPIRFYDGRVYVLNDVATLEVGGRSLTEDTTGIFCKGDWGSGVGLQGDRGPSGARGLKGDSGDKVENVALKDTKVLLERLVKWDLLEAKVKLEHVVKKVTRETLAVSVNQDL